MTLKGVVATPSSQPLIPESHPSYTRVTPELHPPAHTHPMRRPHRRPAETISNNAVYKSGVWFLDQFEPCVRMERLYNIKCVPGGLGFMF